jgi:phosphomannomutase
MKRLIVFDLDGTLARSKSAIDAEMSLLLGGLLDVVRVAIISGGDWPQFEAQVLGHLRRDAHMSRLSLLPTCGTKFFAYDARWQALYSEDLSTSDKSKILGALNRALDETGLRAKGLWGEAVEDRASQITFSALGQHAPLDAKAEWDPHFDKRQKIRAVMETLIPGFSIRLGGTTSIDVTKLGIDKAYGIRKLKEVIGVPLEEMLFIGDALFVGGNDRPAKDAGVTCIQVRDAEETKRVIETLLACLERPEGALGPTS